MPYWSLSSGTIWVDHYCVKSVRIRSFSGPHFPTFGLNMERDTVRIRSKGGKIRTRKTRNMDTFHALHFAKLEVYERNKNLEITKINVHVKCPKQSHKNMFYRKCLALWLLI